MIAVKGWMMYAVAGAAVASLVVGAYYMGRASYRAEAAEAQAAAVSAAHEEARQRWQQALTEQRERTQEHRARVRALEADLEAADNRIEAFADTAAGARECLGEEGRNLWDAL